MTRLLYLGAGQHLVIPVLFNPTTKHTPFTERYHEWPPIGNQCPKRSKKGVHCWHTFAILTQSIANTLKIQVFRTSFFEVFPHSQIHQNHQIHRTTITRPERLLNHLQSAGPVWSGLEPMATSYDWNYNTYLQSLCIYIL